MSFYTLRIKHNTRIDERTGDVMEKMTSGLINRWGRLVCGWGRDLQRRLSLKRVVYSVKINHDAEQVIVHLTSHRNIFIYYVNARRRWAEGTPSVIDISSQPMRILLHVRTPSSWRASHVSSDARRWEGFLCRLEELDRRQSESEGDRESEGDLWGTVRRALWV